MSEPTKEEKLDFVRDIEERLIRRYWFETWRGKPISLFTSAIRADIENSDTPAPPEIEEALMVVSGAIVSLKIAQCEITAGELDEALDTLRKAVR